MKHILLIGVLTILVLGACGEANTTQESPLAPDATNTTLESPLAPGIPNPASKYCEGEGNRLEIRTGADGGQVGYCVFADGTECEEWAYFRGECKPGTPKP